MARRHIANGRDVGRVERGDEPVNARPSAGAAVGCVQAASGPGRGGRGWPWASSSRQARRGEPAPPRRPASRLALRKRSMNCSALPTADSGSSGMSMHHHHGQVDCRCQRRQGQRALWPRGLPRDHQPRATHAGLAARAEPGRGRSLAGGAGRGLFAAQASSEK